MRLVEPAMLCGKEVVLLHDDTETVVVHYGDEDSSFTSYLINAFEDEGFDAVRWAAKDRLISVLHDRDGIHAFVGDSDKAWYYWKR